MQAVREYEDDIRKETNSQNSSEIWHGHLKGDSGGEEIEWDLTNLRDEKNWKRRSGEYEEENIGEKRRPWILDLEGKWEVVEICVEDTRLT